MNKADDSCCGNVPGRAKSENSCDSHWMKILVYFQYFTVFGGPEMLILSDCNAFCSVWATPTNRASEAFRAGSRCANSGGSNLLIMLACVEDLDLPEHI